MKKIYSLAVVCSLICMGGRSFSQSFTFANTDTTVCGAYNNIDLECYNGDYIKNNTSNPITVDVVRVLNDTATAGWTSAFCLNGNCYAPFKDSVRTTIPGDSTVGIIIHFYPDTVTPGCGIVRYSVRDANNPATVAYQTYHACNTCTGVNELSLYSADVNMYPSPVTAGSNFSMNITNVISKSRNISLVVFSIYGSVVRTLDVKEGNNTLNLDLSPGIYSYSLISDNDRLHSGRIPVIR